VTAAPLERPCLPPTAPPRPNVKHPADNEIKPDDAGKADASADVTSKKVDDDVTLKSVNDEHSAKIQEVGKSPESLDAETSGNGSVSSGEERPNGAQWFQNHVQNSSRNVDNTKPGTLAVTRKGIPKSTSAQFQHPRNRRLQLFQQTSRPASTTVVESDSNKATEHTVDETFDEDVETHL
jgi:hypothetical protein